MKTKTQSKTKKSAGKGREKTYPAYYLAAALALVLIIEGLLLAGASTPLAWQQGLKVLDVSSGVSVVMADTYWAAEPLLDQVDSITQFYNLAATEMMTLLDASDSDPLMFPRGVNEFYRLASVEMAKVLDVSDQFTHLPQVAGASISR